MKLEEKLVSLRKAKGLSQLKLAEMMNVLRQAISRWEVGSAVPSTDTLKFLGHLYNVPLEYLLHDDAIEPLQQEINNKDVPEKRSKRKYKRVLWLVIIGAIIIGLVFVTALLKESSETVSMNN